MKKDTQYLHEAMRRIMYLQHKAHETSIYVSDLEDKIKFQGLEKVFSDIYGKLIQTTLDVEDMDKITVEKCEYCNSVL